ncbi:regulator of G-protein signaling 8-like [Daphnia pulex]|nr:regulator of G-protein signaling 8-like [Daphnia pulex]
MLKNIYRFLQRSNSFISLNTKSCKPEMRLLNLKSGLFLRRRNSDSPLSARPQPEEAQKWSESFAALMASKYGSSLYRAFLLREFSNENLEFWLAVEEYKNSKPQKMAAKAQQIYNDFVATQSPKEVNLDSETRLLTLTNVQSNNPDQHVFDRAQRRIQHMMERDSYLRFLQSKLFLELAFPERYSSSSDVSD